jgi:hypothetical protein
MLGGLSVRFMLRSRTRKEPLSTLTFFSVRRDDRKTLNRMMEKKAKTKVDTVVTASRFNMSTKKGFMIA